MMYRPVGSAPTTEAPVTPAGSGRIVDEPLLAGRGPVRHGGPQQHPRPWPAPVGDQFRRGPSVWHATLRTWSHASVPRWWRVGWLPLTVRIQCAPRPAAGHHRTDRCSGDDRELMAYADRPGWRSPRNSDPSDRCYCSVERSCFSVCRHTAGLPALVADEAMWIACRTVSSV